MEITNVHIYKAKIQNKLKAYATVTFDDCFVVHDIRIIEGNGGLFICMPSRKDRNGEFINIAHPIDNNFREKLSEALLNAYNNSLKDTSA